jgi:hypothetical protein
MFFVAYSFFIALTVAIASTEWREEKPVRTVEKVQFFAGYTAVLLFCIPVTILGLH